MCTSGEKFSRSEIFEAIQSTVAHIATEKPFWAFKCKDSENGLYFGMASELKLPKYKIRIIEYGGNSALLKDLINQAVIRSLIGYDDINFLLYHLNMTPPKTKFFNLFLGFLAKPAPEINEEIMDPILWHVKNVICNGDERLNEYI